MGSIAEAAIRSILLVLLAKEIDRQLIEIAVLPPRTDEFRDPGRQSIGCC
jgi:hypothetical protein